MSQIAPTVREPVLIAPPPAGAAGPEAAMSLNDVLAILRRRAVLIILLLILFGGLATGGWFVAYVFFPLYPGEAFVECISDKPKPVFTTADQALDQKEFERFVLTQAEFVTSPDVLSEVLKTPEVRSTAWYADYRDDPRLLLEFQELVRAVPYRGTNLLRISCQTRSPNDPHVIVNQVMTHYLARIQENNIGSFRRERTTYQNDLEGVVKQIADKRVQLLELQKRLPPGFSGFESNAAAQGLAEAKKAVDELEVTTQELEGLYGVYTQPGGAALSPEDLQFVESDPTVTALSNQLILVQQQIAIERDKLGANHREVRRLLQTRDVLDTELNKLRQQKTAEVRAFRQEQVRTAWLTSQHALLLAREKLADAEAYMADMDAVIGQYRLIEEEIEQLKLKRDQINDYIDEVERIIREKSAIRVEPRQRAIKPIERSFPSIFLLPAGWVVALVFAVAVPLLLEFVDSSLRTPQDIRRHLSLPLLGVVPDGDDEEIDIQRFETASDDAPQSMFAETFRSIRTNLLFAAPSDRQRTVLITSPKPEDGKTTIACNLALTLAAGGKRVLLVDANFRRPAIDQIFGADAEVGLSNILVGEARFPDPVIQTHSDNLAILPAGPTPPNPAELLASKEMDALLDAAAGAYDQVILDSPPILLASDASVLAAKTDGVIVVCRARTNTRGLASRACAMLRHVDARIFGGILNAAQVRRGGYFREQLRTYYDYGPDEKTRAGPALPKQKAKKT